MSTVGEKPSARLPWAIVGLLAYAVTMVAFRVPIDAGLYLGVGAWWCIAVVADDAPVFKTIAILVKLKSVFRGGGVGSLAAILAVGLLLAVPAWLDRHSRLARPFFYIGAPAAFLSAFGLVTTIGKWCDNGIYTVRHWLGLRAKRLREVLRPAIVKVAISELDALQAEIAPRIERFMAAEAARLKGHYIVKEWERFALSSERISMERHRKMAYEAVHDFITEKNGVEARIMARSSNSFGLSLLKILKEKHRDAVLKGYYSGDGFYGIIEPMTRAEFFDILNEMLTKRGALSIEQAAVDLAELKVAIAERVATSRAMK
jgi:hypothetical protein